MAFVHFTVDEESLGFDVKEMSNGSGSNRSPCCSAKRVPEGLPPTIDNRVTKALIDSASHHNLLLYMS